MSFRFIIAINIFQREVEQVFLQHPAVAACVVTTLLDKQGRQRLAAAVQLHDGTVTAAELLDFYLLHGAVFATPSWLQDYAQLPRNGGGKPDRQRIARDLQQSYDASELALALGAA